MCGIFGIWFTQNNRVDRSLLVEATNLIRHRGPDDEGYLLVDTQTGQADPRRGGDTIPELLFPHIEQEMSAHYDLAFGFRRLAILDLSASGHQPMSNIEGDAWIVYNGEVYNYIELKSELQSLGYVFRTNSDTEVVLHAYLEWGEACLNRFCGMWSFAIWDQRHARLFCARDRFGIKPFYYWHHDGVFAFASEIKSIRKLPMIENIPNEPLIFDYLNANLLDHTEGTFFKGIQQLKPAHYLIIDQQEIHTHRYWDIDFLRACIEDEQLLVENFRWLFEDSVRMHLRSDVPIGSCLSGGLDSSTIVCVANQFLTGSEFINFSSVGDRQKTFSSCFEDPRYDERRHIEEVIAHTGAERNYIFPSIDTLYADLLDLMWHQEEPFGSLSIFAQWSVMRLIAHRGVKVTLDGQGGDEVLAGYLSCFDYFWNSLFMNLRWGQLRREWAAYHNTFSTPYHKIILRTFRPNLPAALAGVLRHYMRSGIPGMQTIGISPDFARANRKRNFEHIPALDNALNSYLYTLLTSTSLPKLLHYEDRNSMAHSVEARVPFLDHRLVEFVFSLPNSLKIRQGRTKVILREAFQNILPESIHMRADKMGFVTPERDWITGKLRPLAVEVFNSKTFQDRGYFNVPEILRVYEQHSLGKIDLTPLAWRWINLEYWLRNMNDKH